MKGISAHVSKMKDWVGTVKGFVPSRNRTVHHKFSGETIDTDTTYRVQVLWQNGQIWKEPKEFLIKI
jgi:hypothetical protein